VESAAQEPTDGVSSAEDQHGSECNACLNEKPRLRRLGWKTVHIVRSSVEPDDRISGHGQQPVPDADAPLARIQPDEDQRNDG
jgi:hypothetical protein